MRSGGVRERSHGVPVLDLTVPDCAVPDCAVPDRAVPDQVDLDGAVLEPGVLGEGPASPLSVGERVIGGTSALGAGIFLERSFGFVANILAARFAGAQVFGAYSLGISTANQISTYAAGGIGATAARFSGKYPYGSPGYSTLARALTIVSLVSALLAVTGLWFGAGPLAHLMGKAELTSLLRWASLSAAGIIILECARGFFVGQRRLKAVVLLSGLVALGMITLIPMAARMRNPVRMITLQGCITTCAVLVCILFRNRLRLRAASHRTAATPRLAPMLREVWSFGFIQLAGLAGTALAGWWVTTLVARGDTTLVQMSFVAIASQLRNIVGITPGLLTEGSYAVMADPEGESERTPHRVMALCTYASVSMSLLPAAIGIIAMPWLLALLYGRAYSSAASAVAIALAIAVIHMGNAPASARLSIVSIRATGVINTIWAIFVASSASVLLLHNGKAAVAMAIYYAGHALSAVLVLVLLARKDYLPTGMLSISCLALLSSASLAALAVVRGIYPMFTLPVTGLMLMVLLIAGSGLFLLGRHSNCLPSASVFRSLSARILSSMPWRANHV